MQRDGVEAQPVEDRGDVAFVGRADVGAFGVADGQDVRVLSVQVVEGQLEVAQARVAARLVEGDVGLVGADVRVSLLDDPAVEGELRMVGGAELLRQALDGAVQSDAQQRFDGSSAVIILLDDGGQLNLIGQFGRSIL